MKQLLTKRQINVEVKKTIGKISSIIIEEAHGADLILMAKKGEHFHLKEGGLLGSVAEAVVRDSGKPVLVTPETFLEIESMGIAYDGSDSASEALKLSLKLSKQPSCLAADSCHHHIRCGESRYFIHTDRRDAPKRINCPDS